MERAGLLETRRAPVPRADLASNPVHSTPLVAPLPHPELVVDVNGDPSPDRGITQVWPPGAGPEQPS